MHIIIVIRSIPASGLHLQRYHSCPLHHGAEQVRVTTVAGRAVKYAAAAEAPPRLASRHRRRDHNPFATAKVSCLKRARAALPGRGRLAVMLVVWLWASRPKAQTAHAVAGLWPQPLPVAQLAHPSHHLHHPWLLWCWKLEACTAHCKPSAAQPGTRAAVSRKREGSLEEARGCSKASQVRLAAARSISNAGAAAGAGRQPLGACLRFQSLKRGGSVVAGKG